MTCESCVASVEVRCGAILLLLLLKSVFFVFSLFRRRHCGRWVPGCWLLS
jgi:hypothetical protein